MNRLKPWLTIFIGLAVLIPIMVVWLAGAGSTAAGHGISGTLYIGSDNEEFTGLCPPDENLGEVQVTGGIPNLATLNIINPAFCLNGLAPTGTGNLFSGDPNFNLHRELKADGTLLNTVVSPLPNNSCCNEDLALDPATGNVWRPHFGGGPLVEYNPATGALVSNHVLTDGVGATFVGNQLWVTKWGPRQVGTYDTNNDTFTPEFSTATNAGGLAYCGGDVLWVGEGGGIVQAWDLSQSPPTVIAGSTFQPFSTIGNTIDGLACIVPTHAVGGTTSFLTGGSTSSAGSIALLVGGAAAVVAITAGGWYTRRRWLRS